MPTPLTMAWRVLSVSDWPVPVSAARCTTVSGRTAFSTASQLGPWVTSAGTKRTSAGRSAGRPGPEWTWGCRESITHTSWP